jgi:hypothetical protein
MRRSEPSYGGLQLLSDFGGSRVIWSGNRHPRGAWQCRTRALWYGGGTATAHGSGEPVHDCHDDTVPVARSLDFWLRTSSFGICGFSTKGLINTHLIAYCADRGISEVTGASVLAVLGAFSLVGAAGSGWLCDRYNPRVLLFWYYGLRGAVARRAAVHVLRPRQPVDLLNLLRARLGCHRPRHLCADQRGVRPA